MTPVEIIRRALRREVNILSIDFANIEAVLNICDALDFVPIGISYVNKAIPYAEITKVPSLQFYRGNLLHPERAFYGNAEFNAGHILVSYEYRPKGESRYRFRVLYYKDAQYEFYKGGGRIELFRIESALSKMQKAMQRY